MGIVQSKQTSIEKQGIEKLLSYEQSEKPLELVRWVSTKDDGPPSKVSSFAYFSGENNVKRPAVVANINNFAKGDRVENDKPNRDKPQADLKYSQETVENKGSFYSKKRNSNEGETHDSTEEQTPNLSEIQENHFNHYKISEFSPTADADFHNSPHHESSCSASTEQTDISYDSTDDVEDIPSDLKDIIPFLSDTVPDRMIGNLNSNQTFQTTTEVLQNLGIDSLEIDELAEWLDNILTDTPSNSSVNSGNEEEDTNFAVSDAGSSPSSEDSPPCPIKETVYDSMPSVPATVHSAWQGSETEIHAT